MIEFVKRLVPALVLPLILTIAPAESSTKLYVNVDKHGVFKSTNMKSCPTRDTGVSCGWNLRGARRGYSFWVGGYGKTHYVWPSDPTAATDWKWRTPTSKCIVHPRIKQVRCPWPVD